MIKKLSWSNILITLSLLLWSGFFVLQFVKFQDANKISYFAANIEFILHGFTLFLFALIYKKTYLPNKKILSWLLVSLIGLFLNDIIFYYVIYLQNNYIARLSSLDFLLDMSPFFIWVTAIIIFFYKILRITFELKYFYKILSVFMILNATVIFVCFSSINYATYTITWQNVLQFFGYIAESFVFELAILCLIFSKNRGLSWIATGFAILISGDFFLTYTHLTQTDNTLGIHGELFWFLGMLFILIGIYDFKHNESKAIDWLKEAHSIKHIFAFWTFRVSLLSTLPAIILAYYFLPISKELFLLLPPILILYSIVLVSLSLLNGHQLEIPFKQLETNIDALMLKQDKSQVNGHFSINEFIFLQKFINQAAITIEEKDKAKQTLLYLSSQVAHDIRSPLAAINTAISDVSSIPEKKRIMIRSAAKRINDIANNLLLTSKNNVLPSQENMENEFPELIFVVLDNIVAEKRYEYYGTNIQINLVGNDSSFNCFSNVHLASFKCVLSNLINNGIEALDSEGFITIYLNCNKTHVEIIIEDNGCGIPSHILPKITQPGFSFNKKTGAGFGLAHANQYLNQLKGTMNIDSQENIGTKITVRLNRSQPPIWFCDQIKIKHNINIVILDDEPSIHDSWEDRFESFPTVNIIHCYSVTELLKNNISKVNQLYLIDYELGTYDQSGLDVIEELNLTDKAILVTSCFEDINIRKRCEVIGVQIIPKAYVPYTKIMPFSNNEPQSNFVFIDDDEMMRTTWRFAAEDAKQTISTYSSFADFINEIDSYSKNTVIYIDSDLGNNVKGEECAKYLFDKGFTKVHLSTGHSKDQFKDMPWIKTIVSKEPPFIISG
ncbi:sensor histidine kinase [Legionella drozanskii]|uniref:histidine kinase n=1 Tax=Legionella drozanskii LLAP-1 TaxID=1212489 RepID=A0A0W0SWC5_9GAMM|nr:HAMP domain-containing sensor histidine kinase [Legionella drozanskii]KTC87671.1 sensory histidine kinase in two-component regulatory system with QseB [Legionella drozanskii LLAP-1]